MAPSPRPFFAIRSRAAQNDLSYRPSPIRRAHPIRFSTPLSPRASEGPLRGHLLPNVTRARQFDEITSCSSPDRQGTMFTLTCRDRDSRPRRACGLRFILLRNAKRERMVAPESRGIGATVLGRATHGLANVRANFAIVVIGVILFDNNSECVAARRCPGDNHAESCRI
jgi:hypothetical protein